jgi:hypothetical protein
MLPFHGDLFARMGQLPLALLAAAALYGTGRKVGLPPAHAVYAPVFYLLARPVTEQMVGANVDLVCAAFFLCALYFAVGAIDDGGRGRWVLFGISAGLFAGTKYAALVYLPILLVFPLARGFDARSVWALPGIVMFGASWYLRNWLIAGSPIYPATLGFAGVTIARGAFDRAAMLNTVFHTTDVRLIPALAAHAVGPALFVAWLPCVLAGSFRMLRRGWWPAGALVVLPLAMLPLYWFGFPVNTDTRFVLPAVGPALLPLGFLFSSNRGWNLAVHILYLGVFIWLIVGAPVSLPASVPWYMGGWLALDGLVPRPFVGCSLGLAALIAAVWLVARRHPGLPMPLLVATLSIAVVALAAGATTWCGPQPCEYLSTTSPFIRRTYLMSWEWVSENVRGATIAYTGINLPYPLTGRHLVNRVVYANIDGRPRWRFHDYDHAYWSGRFAPQGSQLAISSGELLPVADRSGPRHDALRPRYDRMYGNRDAWLFALEGMKVTHLFVAVLSAYEIDYQWHDEQGFPIENQWAEGDPVHFRLAYENSQVRLYAFNPVRSNG